MPGNNGFCFCPTGEASVDDHPTFEKISGYVLGTLPEGQAEEVALHIAACETCDVLASELETRPDDFIQILRTPADSEQFDPACQPVMAIVRTIGSDPALHEPAEKLAAGTAPPSELAWIGPYQLQEKLGEGGMGAVYKAVHTRLRRTVAIKVLSAERVQSAAAVARFDREMQAVGALDHANIVRAFDAGEHGGRHYIAMEYVNGCNVAQLARVVGQLPVADACELIRQAALGLQHAYEAGLVHRDIKPANLMLTSSGVVKILDLGLALLEQDHSRSELTSAGQVMGTLDYMAPEQGNNTHAVDIRADIYSLGASLYRLLTGTAPFGDDKYDTPMKKLMALATVEPAPVESVRADVPVGLARALKKMLAKAPEERFAIPAEVEVALAPFAAGADLQALIMPAQNLPREQADTTPHLSASLNSTTESPRRLRSQGPAKIGGGLGPPRKAAWTLAAAFGGLPLLLLSIWIIVRDKDNNIVAKFKQPDGGSFAAVEVPSEATPAAPQATTPAVPKADEASSTSAPAAAPEPGLQLRFTRENGKPTPVFREVLAGGLSPELFVRMRSAIDEHTLLPLDSPVIEQLHLGRVAWSQDRSRFVQATGSEVLVWDASHGIVERRWTHDQEIMMVCLAPDGTLAAAADTAHSVLVWDVSSGKHVSRVSLTAGQVLLLAWVPDGSTLLCGDTSGLYCINPRTGQREQVFDIKLAGRETIARSPRSHVWLDGSLLALRGVDGIHLFDAAGQSELRLIPAPPDGRFSPDGAHYIWRLDQRLWQADLRTGVVTELAAGWRSGNEGWIAVSPDGHYRTSHGGALDIAYIVDEPTGKRSFSPAEFERRFDWANDPSHVVALDLELPPPDVTRRPAAVNLEIAPQPVEFERGKPLGVDAAVVQPANLPGLLSWTVTTLPGRDTHQQIVFSPQSDRFLTCNSARPVIATVTGVTIWATKSRRPIAFLPRLSPFAPVRWSPDGRYLLAGVDNDPRTIAVWDSTTGKLIRRWSHEEETAGLDWSPDGNVIAYHTNFGSRASCCWLRDPKSGAVLDVLEQSPLMDRIEWSSSGRYLALSLWEPHIHHGMVIWDSETKRVVGSLPAATSYGQGFTWLRGQSELAAVSHEDGALMVSNGVSIPRRRQGKVAAWRAGEMSSSPDGSQVAMLQESRITLIDTRTLEPVRRLEPAVDAGPVWSPDGKLIAAANSGTMAFWQPKLSTPLEVLEGCFRGPFDFYARWSAGGQSLVEQGGLEQTVDPDRWARNSTGAFIYGNMDGLWRAFEGKVERIDPDWHYNNAFVEFSPDESLFAAVRMHGGDQVDIRESSTGALKQSWSLKGAGDVCWHPDGRHLAVHDNHQVCVLQLGRNDPVASFVSGRIPRFSPDGTRLAIFLGNQFSQRYVTVWKWLEKAQDSPPPARMVTGYSHQWLNDRELVVLGGAAGANVIDAGTLETSRTFPCVGSSAMLNRDRTRLFVSDGAAGVRVYDVASKRLVSTVLYLRDGNWAVLSPEGHYSCSEGAREWLYYVALTEDGSQITLAPDEFERRYGWRNDPEKARRTLD